MKKLHTAFRVLIGVLGMLCTLAFAGIELWAIVSGDWQLFENDVTALLQLCVRLLLLCYCFGICLWSVMRRERSFRREGLQLLAISLAVTPFLSNHLGWAFVLLSVLFLLAGKAAGK